MTLKDRFSEIKTQLDRELFIQDIVFNEKSEQYSQDNIEITLKIPSSNGDHYQIIITEYLQGTKTTYQLSDEGEILTRVKIRNPKLNENDLLFLFQIDITHGCLIMTSYLSIERCAVDIMEFISKMIAIDVLYCAALPGLKRGER